MTLPLEPTNPCPNCNAKLHIIVHEGPLAHRVRCQMCQFQGSVQVTQSHAIFAWNRNITQSSTTIARESPNP